MVAVLCARTNPGLPLSTVAEIVKPVASMMAAVPVPVPTPVAVNSNPTVFDDAPTNVKSVVPNVVIEYLYPTSNVVAPTLVVLGN